MDNRKKISVVTPCYNEEENVFEVYQQVKAVFDSLPQFEYEHIFIDNCSKDKTVEELRKIAANDKNVKVIINARNFGHIRSPYHGLMKATGDAVISIVADLQDPPNMIREFLEHWENGFKIVVGIKAQSEESWLFFHVRKMYYRIATKLSDTELLQNFTGFGLYDKQVIGICRQFDDPYPYFRGMICDIGFEMKKIPYIQPLRKRGLTKNNFYTLYDLGMLGITNHSKVPLRLAALTGLGISIFSFLVALIYLIYKLLFWNSFSVGIAPLVIGIFFFGAVQLFFIGIIGEYIGSIQTQVLKRPHVIEKERINF
jgi:glycosyltransferase involved in cell wall biosynthesis